MTGPNIAPESIVLVNLASQTESLAENLGQVHAGFNTIGSMGNQRFLHSATLLKDGRVLIAGGMPTGSSSLFEAEVYDPSPREFTAAGEMMRARARQAAVLVDDRASSGKVLIVGGADGLDSAELFDPATLTFAVTKDNVASFAGRGCKAVALKTRKVLVVGSLINSAKGSKVDTITVLYDPYTDSFLEIFGSLFDTAGMTLTVLNDGRVLAAGGWDGTKRAQVAKVFDPAENAAVPTGKLITPRAEHVATLLQDGSVLITGGNADDGRILADAEIYDPRTGTFSSTGKSLVPRMGHTATLLDNGLVLIAGGNANTFSVNAELFDLDKRAFERGEKMILTRAHHTATLLKNGDVLIAGGLAERGPTPRCELYHPDLRIRKKTTEPNKAPR
jgi:hypothetical protein